MRGHCLFKWGKTRDILSDEVLKIILSPAHPKYSLRSHNKMWANELRLNRPGIYPLKGISISKIEVKNDATKIQINLWIQICYF